VTITEAKILLMAACEGNDESSAIFRRAVAALPDRARLDQLDPLARALIETRLHQLVTAVALGETAEYAP
jgi:hypothetical protein